MHFLKLICIIFLFSSVIASHVSHASHACAPLIPPIISGPYAPSSSMPGYLFLNEVLPNPHTIWTCTASNPVLSPYETAWVELYNAANQPFDLYSTRVSLDTGPGTHAYYVPFQATIAAHGFLVLFPCRDHSFSMVNTTLRLVAHTIVLDTLPVVTLGNDQSYARASDGADPWLTTLQPTIASSNQPLSLSPTTRARTPTAPRSTPAPTPITSASSTAESTGSASTNNWRGLQLPAAPTSQPSPTAPLPVQTAHQPDPSDAPAKIALTALAALALIGLLWRWRRSGVP